MSRKIILFVSLFFLFQHNLYAQDTLYNPLNEVVVTANKFEQKQNTTGKVITVLNKEMIDKNAGKTLPQLLNEQAGIIINGALNNQGSVQTVYTRGASSGRTLILLDGIPVNDPSMINNGFDLNLLSLTDVERIEICKGAQSTLYGSDAVAGVINIITTKKEVSKSFNGNASVEAGNYGTLKGNAQLYGASGKLNYTARFSRSHTNGFSSATDTLHNAGKKFDSDGYDGDATDAQVTYQATKALSIKAFGLFSQYSAGIDAGVFTDDKDDNIHNKSFIGGTGFTYKKKGLSITGNYQYSAMNRHYVNDSLDKTSTWFEDNNYWSKNQYIELYGNVILNKNITFLAGADYRFSSYRELYASISSFGPFNDTAPSRSIHQQSAYASFLYKGIHDKLNIEIGGRINDHSIYGTNRTYTLNPSFSINKTLRVFASTSSGYKAPGIYQLFDKYSGNKDLKAEESKNYEAGFALQNKYFNARAVYFYRDIKNGIDYNYINFQYFNYACQKVNGAELELTVKPTSFITITANYTYLSPRETSQNRLTNYDTVTYHYLLRRPNHSVNTTIGIQPAKPLYISLSAKYVSRRYDVGGYLSPDILLHDYAIFSAYAEYKYKEKTKFFAQAQNLFNKTFYDVYGYNSIPFLLNAGITFSF